MTKAFQAMESTVFGGIVVVGGIASLHVLFESCTDEHAR